MADDVYAWMARAKLARSLRTFKIFMVGWTVGVFFSGVAVGIWTVKILGP